MNLVNRHLSELSSLQYSFLTGSLPSRLHMTFLVVRFEGESGTGCRNNEDAVFMAAIVAAGLQAWKAVGVILDLRSLSYSWGDMMAMPFSVHPDLLIGDTKIPFPTVAIVSDLNRRGLASLVRDEMFSDPEKMLFESLEDAVAEIERQAERIWPREHDGFTG
jgi:hypothetical protein